MTIENFGKRICEEKPSLFPPKIERQEEKKSPGHPPSPPERQDPTENQREEKLRAELEAMKQEMKTLREGVSQVILSQRQEERKNSKIEEPKQQQLGLLKKWMNIVLSEKHLILKEKAELESLRKKYKQKQSTFCRSLDRL